MGLVIMQVYEAIDISSDKYQTIDRRFFENELKIQTNKIDIENLELKKVEKEEGKTLSTEDYTTEEKNKLSGIAIGAQVNKIEKILVNNVEQEPNEDKEVNISVESGGNDNVIEKILVNNIEQTPVDKTVNIPVPTKISVLTNDAGFITQDDIPTKASDVGALPDTTKYGFTLSGSYDGLTGEITILLKGQDGTTLSTQIVDLPLELLISTEGSYYDNGIIYLKLANGEYIQVDVAELIDSYTSDGTTIVMSNRQFALSTTYKAKIDNAVQKEEGKDLFSGSYNDLTNKPNIPSVEGLATEVYVNNAVDNKVDKIAGKGLSSNDYTNEDKNKLTTVEENAQVNVVEVVKIGDLSLPVVNKQLEIPFSATDKAGIITSEQFNLLADVKSKIGVLFAETRYLVYLDYNYSPGPYSLKKIDIEGNLVWEHQLSKASYALAVDDMGNIYCGSDDFYLRKFNSDGELLWERNTYGYVKKVTLDGKGFVYYISGISGPFVISRVSTSNTLPKNLYSSTSFGGASFAVLLELAVDGNGNVYFTQNGYSTIKSKILKFNFNAEKVWEYTVANYIGYLYGIAVDSLGNVYFGGDNKKLIKLNRSGTLIWEYPVDDAIRDIAIDNNDDVIIATGTVSKILCSTQKISKEGEHIWTYTDFTDAVIALDIDGNDVIYCSSYDKKITILNSDGTLIKYIVIPYRAEAVAANIYDEALSQVHSKSLDNPHGVTKEQLGITGEVAYQEKTITPIPIDLMSGVVYYGTLSTDLTFTGSNFKLANSGYLSQWHIVATMGITAYNITFPSIIKWSTALPTFEANKIYEFSIVKIGDYYLGTYIVYE